MARGLDADDVAPSLFMFLSSGLDLLEEVAKFRAARIVWNRVASERLGADDPESRALRIFAFTAGSLLRAQQPRNNIARVTLEALAAVLGGVQTLHASGYDEALGVPSLEAATLALRTQQILLEESGLQGVVDPLGGSWALEALTDELVDRIEAILSEIDERGGALACIESGWFADRLAEGAYAQQRAEETGERKIVGVNAGVDESETVEVAVFRPDLDGARRQVARTVEVRASRDPAAHLAALARLHRDATDGANIVPVTIEAVRAYATVGEITDTLRGVYGTYQAR